MTYFWHSIIKSKLTLFLIYSIHKKIIFTKELEENNHLPFLDANIRKTQDNIETTFFKKQSHTGLYTRWDSYIPYKYKQNLVLTLLERAFKICSNYKLIHKEFQNILLHFKKMDFQILFSTN